MFSCLRIYVPGVDDFGSDGYPLAWHAEVKHLVREQADHRCVRCGHPYRCGEQGNGEWSACDEECVHDGPIRSVHPAGGYLFTTDRDSQGLVDPEAQWRILTVHHLTGDKADCRWWNLVAVCQRCHLWLQRRVVMDQVWPFEHDNYFKPYAAGFYAAKYLGEDLTREQTMARLDELLALERVA